MDYFDENRIITLKAYFDKEAELEQRMKVAGKTEEEIAAFKTTLLALQLVSRDYIERSEKEPDFYPDMTEKSMDVAAELHPFIKGVFSRIAAYEDGDLLTEKVDLLSTFSQTRIAKRTVDAVGIQDNVFERVQAVVVNNIELMFNIAANDKSGEFENQSNGLIVTTNILKRYPEMLRTMTDEVSQKVFKNGRDSKGKKQLNRNGGINHYTYTGSGKSGSGFFLLSTNIKNANDTTIIEKDFTYYDWAVMEAIISLYEKALDSQADNNGEVLLDLKSIDKVIKHLDGSRMSRQAQDNIEKTELYQSIKRLLGNHIYISEDALSFDDDFINGEIILDSGKVCLLIKKIPVLLDFVLNNGRGYATPIPISKLKLKEVRYTHDHVAIYRYLLHRVKEIYDSYFIDPNHLTPTARNSIPLDNVIDTVYPDFYSRYSDTIGRKRDVKKIVEAIFEEMKNKHIISNAKEVVRADGTITYELERQLQDLKKCKSTHS